MLRLHTVINRSLPPIALYLTLVISAQTFAHQHSNQKHYGMGPILSQLSLTDTQQQDIKQLLSEIPLLRGERQSLKPVLRRLLQTSQWDETAVEQTLIQHQSLRQEQGLQRAIKQNQIWNLLDAGQQVLWLAKRKARLQERHSKGQSKRKNTGKRLSYLALTDQQKTAVRSIRKRAHTTADKTKSNLQIYKKTERELIQNSQFTADTWQSLNAQYQNDFLAMAVIRVKTKHDIWLLLTPEQRAKAANKRERQMQVPERRKHQHQKG